MSGSPTSRLLSAKIDEALTMLHTQSLHVTNINMKFDGLDRRLDEQVEPRIQAIEQQTKALAEARIQAIAEQAEALNRYIHHDNGQSSLASQVKRHGEWIENWEQSRKGWASEFKRGAVGIATAVLMLIGSTVGMLVISHGNPDRPLTGEDIKKVIADEIKAKLPAAEAPVTVAAPEEPKPKRQPKPRQSKPRETSFDMIRADDGAAYFQSIPAQFTK